MRSELGSIFTAALALVLAGGCADFQRGAYWDEAESASASETAVSDGGLGYAADVHALLDTGCERCHAPSNSAGNTDFLIISDDIDASYESTLEFVDLDDPAASRLLAKMAGLGHGGGAVFDDRSPEYALILAWIEQGAPP
jgi:hypothetical protein